jgi:hypothetical protein
MKLFTFYRGGAWYMSVKHFTPDNKYMNSRHSRETDAENNGLSATLTIQ